MKDDSDLAPVVQLHPDEPRTYRPGELADDVDVAGLSRRVERLEETVRTGFDLLGIKLDNAFRRIGDTAEDHGVRLNRTERDVAAIESKLREAQLLVTALDRSAKKRRKK